MSEENKSTLGQRINRDILFGTSDDLPRIIEVDLANLRANPDQPRTIFKPETIEELAASIEQHGLIQPIAIVKDGEKDGGYIIVAGERRFRAYQKLGRSTIPAIVTTGNPDEIALIENIQREDLSSIDEAEALAKMMTRHNYKQEELAKVVGKSRPTITELLSLNALPDDIKQECRTFDIPKSILVQIVRVGTPEEQHRFWDEYKKGEVKTVREAKKRKAGEEITKPPQPKPKKLFHTDHKASVIVQSETSRITQGQIVSALQHALEQAQESKSKPSK
jgi:ParB family chromosome partitioning protein